MGAHGVLHPREALNSARSALAMIVSEELHAAPRTSLNVPIGTRRRFDVVRVPLADLREIKTSLGGTLNDVVLTVTTSALRALLQSRGEPLPTGGLRAMVPMNVRVASEHLALGNRISSLFLELPVAQADPVRRYHETVARSESLKSAGEQAAGTTAVIELAGLAPPVIHSTIAQALYATRLFNVTITNVPGPKQTLYAFGAPLREIHPLVPLAAEHAVGVAALSYDGNVFFGVVADRDTVPDLEVLLSALRASVEELRSAARTGTPPKLPGAG
jgi:WS/DGAT/MGAT family acyltransferase